MMNAESLIFQEIKIIEAHADMIEPIWSGAAFYFPPQIWQRGLAEKWEGTPQSQLGYTHHGLFSLIVKS